MTALVLKYIKFADNHQNIKKRYDISSTEGEILRVITKASLCETSSIKVRNLLDMSHIASPATIHKAMKSLISKGLLKVNSDESDGRIKYLAPTPRSMKLLNEIGKSM